MEKLKKLIGIGAPGGLDDLIVRAVKVGILAFVGVAGASVIGWTDPTLLEAAGQAALAAAAGVVLNAVLMWANKE